MNFLRQMAGGLSMLILLFLTGISDANTYYVWQDSPANGPGDSWADAFHDIQSAVNVTSNGDTVLVTNGNYNTGGVAISFIAYSTTYTITNRIYVTNAITVYSINGPAATLISGNGYPSGLSRCAFLATNAVLSGFTLENGAFTETPAYGANIGGGVFGGTVTNCVLTGNTAYYGGGAYNSRLVNCTLSKNSAVNYGGGAYNCTLYNCVISQNNGNWAGGAMSCSLSNCVVANNNSGNYAGGAYGCALTN